MASHSSIPAWKSPWTEEPGRLEATGSQKSWTQLSMHAETGLLSFERLNTLFSLCL